MTITELKKQHGSIYETEVEGETYLWRELTRAEHNRIIRFIESDWEREEAICALCVLEPLEVDYEETVAGLATVLCNHIMAESGFGEAGAEKVKALLGAFREEMNSFHHQISCIITEAFPNLNIEEVEEWPIEKALWYYSRAEYKMNALRGIELIETETEQAQPANAGLQGSLADFPEAAQQEAFMKGKKVF